MQNLEPAALSASSSVFQLWITQWRLGILDPREASFVLRMVLRDLSAKRVDDPFWRFLRQFLAPPAADAGASLPKDSIAAEQLLLSALSLQPQQAKSLLEYLSQCYA